MLFIVILLLYSLCIVVYIYIDWEVWYHIPSILCPASCMWTLLFHPLLNIASVTALVTFSSHTTLSLKLQFSFFSVLLFSQNPSCSGLIKGAGSLNFCVCRYFCPSKDKPGIYANVERGWC